MLYLNTIPLNDVVMEEKFWFSITPNDQGYPVPDYIYNPLKDKLPAALRSDSNCILYTTFTNPAHSYLEVKIILNAQTIDFFRYYYHYKIHKSLKKTPKLLLHGNYLKVIKAYVKQENSATLHDQYDVFEIALPEESVNFQMLRVQYIGQKRILKQDLDTIISAVKPSHIKELKIENCICQRSALLNSGISRMKEVFPVLNKKLEKDLDLQPQPTHRFSYAETWQKINRFYHQYLRNLECLKVSDNEIPWKSIPPEELGTAVMLSNSKEGNALPKNWNKKLLLNKTKGEDITNVFFILHKDNPWSTKRLFSWLIEGLPESDKHLQLLLQPDKSMETRFNCPKNSYIELSDQLRKVPRRKNTQYIAVLVSGENNKQNIPKHQVNKIKGLLLDKKMVPHTLHVPEQMPPSIPGLAYIHKPNLAIKLDQRSWEFNVPDSNTLIIGIAGVRNCQYQKQLGFTFYCANKGKFHFLSTLPYYRLHQVRAKLQYYINCCTRTNGKPGKVIIHLYENTAHDTLKIIKKEIKAVDINITLILVSIQKRKLNNELAFNPEHNQCIPEQGTFCHLGHQQYLLFNYATNNTSMKPQRPPLKLCLWSNRKDALQDKQEIQNLLSQVYTLSHMHNDALNNKNLPATIFLPMKLAQTVAQFNYPLIPAFGRDKLWFV